MRRMPAAVLALLVVPILPRPAHAQTVFGVKAGMVSSDFKLKSGTDGEDLQKKRTGMAVAGFLRFGGNVALQLEANYTDKGAKADDGIGDVATIKLKYLEAAALLRVAMAGKVSPYLYGGAGAGNEMSCKASGTYQGTAFDVDCDTAGEQSDRRKMDILGIGGAGIQFMAGSLTLLVEGRYALGLRSLSKNADTDAKSRALTFMAGAAFALGGK